MKNFKRAVSLIVIFSMIILFGGNRPAKAVSYMEVHIIDVGQADSIYIKLPNGQNVLIDGGNNEDGPTVVNYLKNQGVTKVDYLVGTHPHEDHIGGLDDVINNFNIGKVYLPDKTSTTQTYADLINAINAKGLTITTAKKGIVLFDTTYNNLSLKAIMLSPAGSSYSDVNDYSPIIRLNYGTASFMLTGDAGVAVENEILNSGQTPLTADILKVAHHGSDTANSEAWLDIVKPKAAVISVGAGNTYGHPTQTVLDRLTARGIDIYRTDMQGTIVYTTSGTTFTASLNPWWDGAQSLGGVTPPPPAENKIVINEILPAPSTAYTTEWVELYNSGDSLLDISGYQIDDIAGGGSSPYTIPAGTTIAAKGYYIYNASSVFNNTGDDVRLISPSGQELDKYTFGSSAADKSWFRFPSGGAWQSVQDSTPTMGTANINENILVNEILPVPSTAYTTEWVELYNPNDVAADISGYQIDDIAGGGSSPYTIPSGTSIPAKGYYVYNASSVFNNTGDDVRLINASGQEIDKYTFGNSAADKSWYRLTSGGAWQSTQDSTPTKGTANN